MNYVRIGKLVNTHGIKGEVRIISDFDKKELVFQVGKSLYIGEDKEKVTVENTRVHKNFDQCVFSEYHYINDVLKFKGKNVYVLREDLDLSHDDYLESDLINMEAFYNGESIGSVKEIVNNNGYKLILVNNHYIPYNKEFISEVSLKDKKITLKNLEGII